MPTPPRTSLEEIVSAGRAVVEAEGLDGLTMQSVARAVGVRAPSLYKHVDGRGELIRLIVEAVVSDLRESLRDAVTGEAPKDDLRSLAHAFRSFAHEHPKTYGVGLGPMPDEWRPEPEVFAAAVSPVLATAGALVGEEKALEAARLVTAWAHGFLTMELTGAFRMGGDVDEAFEFGIDRLADALAAG